MKKIRITLAILALTATVHAAVETWQNDAVDNYWTNVANWSAVVPGSGDEANFTTGGNNYTNINLSSTNTIAVKRIQFGVSSPAYTIGTGGPGTQDLDFEDNGVVNMWEATTADQTFDANLHFGWTNEISCTMNNYSTNANLILAGNIYRTGGNYVDYFRVQRPGTTEIAGTVNNSSGVGDLDVVVDDSRLLLSGGNAWDGDLRVRNNGNIVVTETGTISGGILDIHYGSVTINSDQTVSDFLYFGDDNQGGNATLSIAPGKTVTLAKNPGYYARTLAGPTNNTAIITGGTLDLGGAARTFNVRDNSLVQAVNGAELTIESDIVNTNGAGAKQNITKAYDGTLKFDAANYTYQKLTINQGKLQVNSFDALGTGNQPQVGNGNGDDPILEFLAPSDIDRGMNIVLGDMTAAASNETEGAVILNNGAGKVSFNWNWLNTIDADPKVARTVTFGGTNTLENRYGGIRDHNASGGIVNLVKKDSGKWLGELDSTYTGTTTIEGGTLQLNNH